MSSSRKILQTLQLPPKIGPGSENENDAIIKLHKDVTGTVSNKSEPKQPSRIALSECKENVGVKLNTKAKVSQSNQMNDLKTTTVANLSKCDELIENRTSISDHNSSFDAINWMTANEPAEEYWKELAEQRRIALEESLQENEDLYEAVDSLNAKVESLNRKVDVQNEIISSQKDQLESQTTEIDKLRTLSVEVERLSSILEDLTGGLDDISGENEK